ncbi:sortase family protein [Nonomuraea recticatena]|uniref:hypothetical protein n=1 Tax=Nonomuraea recticatena TaxID=46178 RepID=UPI00361CC48F
MAPHYPEPYDDRGSRILRSTLILAAVAGVLTVVVGLVFMLLNPEEYGLSEGRQSLSLSSQPDAITSGQPRQALFEAPPTAPPPLPQVVPAPPMQPSNPLRVVIKRLGINAPVSSVGVDRKGAIQTPDRQSEPGRLVPARVHGG